jgi:uncharacterized protein (TIGR01732 family)
MGQGYSGGFALIVVLFILLIIVGCSGCGRFYGSGYGRGFGFVPGFGWGGWW